jgi:hypothetical protein
MATKNFNMGSQKIQIKEFDLKQMCENPTIGLIAKRASGKSWITRHILYHMRDIPAHVIISKTEKLNSFYGKFVPNLFIYYKFESHILSKIFERQKCMNEENKLRIKRGKKVKDDRVILVMDDCMGDKTTWIKDEMINELFFNGRHYNIAFLLTLQYSKGITPDLRSNFDYIFLLAEDFISNRKKLYEEYAGMFPTFDFFQQVFSVLTSDHGCMVINNRVHSMNPQDKVFWFKAKNLEHINFQCGTKRFRKFHEENYDNNWNNKIPTIDLNAAFSKKRNGVNLVVEKIN